MAIRVRTAGCGIAETCCEAWNRNTENEDGFRTSYSTPSESCRTTHCLPEVRKSCDSSCGRRRSSGRGMLSVRSHLSEKNHTWWRCATSNKPNSNPNGKAQESLNSTQEISRLREEGIDDV